MLIRLAQFNDVFRKFLEARAEGGTWLHSRLSDVVTPQRLYYSRDEQEIIRNCRDDDDFEHYYHFHLPKLIHLMHEIKKGKMDIAEHVRKCDDGTGLMIDVQTIYMRLTCLDWLDSLANEIRNPGSVKKKPGINELTRDELPKKLKEVFGYYAILPNTTHLAQEWLNRNQEFQKLCAAYVPSVPIPKPNLKRRTFSTVVRKNWNFLHG